MVSRDGDGGRDNKQSRADGVGFIQAGRARPDRGLIVQEAFWRASKSDLLFLLGDCLRSRGIRQSGRGILRRERGGEQAEKKNKKKDGRFWTKRSGALHGAYRVID